MFGRIILSLIMVASVAFLIAEIRSWKQSSTPRAHKVRRVLLSVLTALFAGMCFSILFSPEPVEKLAALQRALFLYASVFVAMAALVVGFLEWKASAIAALAVRDQVRNEREELRRQLFADLEEKQPDERR